MAAPTAIGGISDAKKIRVLLYANGQFVHAALGELIKEQQEEIERLQAAVEEIKQRLGE